MLEKILSLEGVSILNKKQQETINGSGCGYTYTLYASNGDSITYTRYDDNLTLSQVKQYALNNILTNGADNAHYCCASCGDASWLNL